MAATFIAIQTITTTTTPISITFSSIPQTYKHLCLIGNIKATEDTSLNMFINGNTSGVYRFGEMNFSGSVDPAGYKGGSVTTGLGQTYLGTATSAQEIWIPNYVSTNLSKSYLYRNTSIDGASSNRGSYGFGQTDEVGAITSIAFTLSFGTYVNGSNITLYGLI
jgi:hypothetical protein